MNWDTLLNPERPRPSTSTGDHREQFERDYDRAVFSSPVKRLQDKAQVFPMEPHDSVRTRLTHSLEVSSVARGLVQKVCKDFLLKAKHIKDGQDRQIEAIAATCGLIHDLGNPPFGHSGEDAIQEWFKKDITEAGLRKLLDNRDELVNDLLLFEGNAQTLRIVAKLQVLADFQGLNLTCGTLSALCKYMASSVETGKGDDHAKSKTGYFTSENDRVKTIREKTGTGDARNPITFLVEAADDIVYSVADIEDGVKKRILSWSQLDHLLHHAPEAAAAASTVKAVLDGQVAILAPSPNPADLPDDIRCAAFRTAAIRVLVQAAAEVFQQNYDAIMAGKFAGKGIGELVGMGPTAPFVELLKGIGRTKIYCTPSNLKLELLGRKSYARKLWMNG
jgi:dGTPase